MPPSLPPNVVSTIQTELEVGLTPDLVARRNNTSRRTVQKIQASLKTFGTPRPPPMCRRGRPPLLTDAMEEDLCALLAARPTLYLDELQYHILLEFDVWISESTVSRAIHRKKFSRKTVGQPLYKEPLY